MQAAVTFESESNFYTGFSTNLSEGGLFLATDNIQPRGTVIDLTVSLPNGLRVAVKGEVRWIREYNENTPDLMPGMGMQFIGLNPAIAQKMQAFLNERDPIFYDD